MDMRTQDAVPVLTGNSIPVLYPSHVWDHSWDIVVHILVKGDALQGCDSIFYWFLFSDSETQCSQTLWIWYLHSNCWCLRSEMCSNRKCCFKGVWALDVPEIGDESYEMNCKISRTLFLGGTMPQLMDPSRDHAKIFMIAETVTGWSNLAHTSSRPDNS